MKKGILLFACVAMLSLFSSAQGLILGGGLAIGGDMGIDDDGTEKMGLGLNLHGGYGFTEKIAVLGNFNYFFPSTPEGMDLTLWQVAADCQYTFFGNDKVGVYALAGLNWSYAKAGIEIMGVSASVDDSEFGFDIGAGANFSIFFAEFKYDTGFDQVQVTGGVRF